MVSEKYTKRTQHLCAVMKELSGVDPLENSRLRDVVSARMMVSMVLIRDGCTTVQIAELLNMNHAAISHYKNRFKLLSVPGWDVERELWEKFNNAI